MILNIYKPKTWTSFDVVAKTRNLLGIKKVGHAGTLDPLAEGVLLVLTNEDTKKQNELMSLSKEYVFEASFNITSPSYDLEFVPQLVDEKITLQDLIDKKDLIVKNFTGDFDQVPPTYSAKKINGKVAYKLARKNAITESDLKTRRITIREFEVLDIYEKEIVTDTNTVMLPTLKGLVLCSSGTYIRSLVRDIGKFLNTQAVMTSLVRTKVGNYTIDSSQKLENLKI